MSPAWCDLRFAPGSSRPKLRNWRDHRRPACKVFPNGGGSRACSACCVEISDSFTRPLLLEDFRELRFRKVVVTTGNSYAHAFVDDCPLSLIVCGARR